jgi:hypothetical protein
MLYYSILGISILHMEFLYVELKMWWTLYKYNFSPVKSQRVTCKALDMLEIVSDFSFLEFILHTHHTVQVVMNTIYICYCIFVMG